MNILEVLGKFMSRKWLAATAGNLLLAFFAKWILGRAEVLGNTITWAGIVACIALAVGLWVYIVIEGRRDLEIARAQDPYYRGTRLLRLYREATQAGLEPERAFQLLKFALGGRPQCPHKDQSAHGAK
jgi:hypothetical protein